jgi:serine/threonine protein kinase
MKNQVLLGDYALHKDGFLGKGAFASVFKGHRISDNLPVAIKVVKTSKMEQKEKKILDDEVTTLRRMNHENIIKLYDIYERKSKRDTELCLMTELCEGTLEEVIKESSPLTEEIFNSYLHDISFIFF